MTLGLFIGIVFVAFVSEALVGFGSTVLTVTLGANLYPLGVLLPAFVPLNLLLSLYLVGRYHRVIDRRVLLARILPFVALGFPVGLLVSTLEEEALLQAAFGALVVALASVELARRSQRVTDEPRPLRPVTGGAVLFVGGVIHGIYGSGGPMVVYFAGRAIRDKSVFRATLSALWLVLNTALVVGYAVRGQLTVETVELSATLLPALLVGLVIGERLHGRVRERPFRLAVFGLLFFAGAVLAARALSKYIGGPA